MNATLKYQSVSAALLEELRACREQVDLFRATFGGGDTPISRNMILQARNIGLDLGWAARYFLAAPAWEAYKAATAPAREAYEAAMADPLVKIVFPEGA